METGRTWCLFKGGAGGWGILPLDEVVQMNGNLVGRGEAGWAPVELCASLEAAQEKGREWKRKMKEKKMAEEKKAGGI